MQGTLPTRHAKRKREKSAQIARDLEKDGHAQLLLRELIPSPENKDIYTDSTESLRELSRNIQANGILEELVVTQDGYIVSGHRRHAAALMAGIADGPGRILQMKRSDMTTDEYTKLLREHNRQRAKTIDEILREGAIDANPEAAYTSLVAARVKRSLNTAGGFQIDGVQYRKEISEAKRPMLEAALSAISLRQQFPPLSVRQVHYLLLSDPPLRHSKKPGSVYRNDRASSNGLCDLLA